MEQKKTISELYKECKQNVERKSIDDIMEQYKNKLIEAYHIGDPEYYMFHNKKIDEHTKAATIWTSIIATAFLSFVVFVIF